MQHHIQIDTDTLRDYLMGGFPRGYDFVPAYTGTQLVETEKTGGCFTQVDCLGSPKLKAAFVEHMDGNTFGLQVPHGRIAAILNGWHTEQPQTTREEHLNCLYLALYWLIYDRPKGVTQAVVAERIGVTERTVRRWLREALERVIAELQPQPASFVLARAPVYHLVR
jgi:hypothetical protein